MFIICAVESKTRNLLIGFIAFAVTVCIVLLNPLQTLQWKLSDLFFSGRGASNRITIIAIDEKSLDPSSGLGRFKDWPRSYYANLLSVVGASKPSSVAFDLDFREASRGISDNLLRQLLGDASSSNSSAINWNDTLKKFIVPGAHPDDVNFQTAIDESVSPVVLFSSLLFSDEAVDLSEKLPAYKSVVAPIFRVAADRIGYSTVFRDRDSVLRRFIPQMGDQISFPLAIANAASPLKMQSLASSARINYADKPASFCTISFVDALHGKFDPCGVEGKILIVGATARSLQDFHPTPTSSEAMAGPEIIANIVQQLIENKPMHEQGGFSLYLLLALLTVGGAFLFMNLGLRKMAIIFGSVLVIYPILAFLMYQMGTIFNVVYPEIAWICVFLVSLWYRNKTEFKEKKMLKNAFAHYVSPVVVNELVKNPRALKLGGKRQQISVLFSDIVGFTSLAEKLSPEDTVALLNDYLSSMTDVVFEHQGTLDKYQGDAIMALFGAPLEDKNYAINACHAALTMRKALSQLHEKWNSIKDLPFKESLVGLDFRVGIATGPAVVGNVGSEKRFDYTAIGDIVNLGSRLESINKKYGTRIIVDKNTFVAVTESRNPFAFRKLDTVRVKGKVEKTEIFEVVALAENVTSDMKVCFDDFENGRILYTQRNFVEAKKYFENILEKFPMDGPAQIYKNRCGFFTRKPPSMDWDAVVNLEEK